MSVTSRYIHQITIKNQLDHIPAVMRCYADLFGTDPTQETRALTMQTAWLPPSNTIQLMRITYENQSSICPKQSRPCGEIHILPVSVIHIMEIVHNVYPGAS